MGKITAPEPLTSDHALETFDCGAASLNDWLHKRALKNEASGASRTFVVCEDEKVIGFYALAVGSIMRQEAPGKIKRNMPEPIPVMILGRLAVATSHQGAGIGGGMLKDAVLRTLNVSRHTGIRALLVHALNDSAKQFYLRNGFVESPLNPFTLMLNLKDLQYLSPPSL